MYPRAERCGGRETGRLEQNCGRKEDMRRLGYFIYSIIIDY